MLDGVLELTLPQLARELANADVPGAAEVVRAGLTRWLASAASDDELKALAQFALNDVAARPAKDVLAELGLLAVVRERGAEALSKRISEVVASPAFATWAAS
jgi:hypothetical protein